MVLQLNSVSKSFGVDEILNDINISVEATDRIGIIGKNGSGKTTLLNIIANNTSYDSGNVSLAKDARVGFLKQTGCEIYHTTIWEEMISVFEDISNIEKSLRNLEVEISMETDEAKRNQLLNSYAKKSEMFEKKDGFLIKTKIQTILNGMGFDKFDVNMSVDKLSGGEKTKLSFAKLLLEEREILLLDEPTNHLDFKTMQWLEGYLKTYKGAIITVSHDRYFLDKSVNTIYEIENTRIKKYTGNYSAYLTLKEQNLSIEEKAYRKQQTEIKKLEDYIAKNLVRASTTKMAQSRQKKLDKMELLDKPAYNNDSASFVFEQEYSSYKEVLNVDNLSIFVNSNNNIRTLCKNISFNILRGEKVALIGDNGIGKSTLIKTILGIHTQFEGDFVIGRNTDIGYYDQELKILDNKKTVFDEIYDRHPRFEEGKIRSLLGSMNFYDEDVFKKVEMLSGGEKAKLAFLTLMLEKNNTLFLDEPTNHLDLASKENLDIALKNFEGTIFFVSHDRYFLNKVATKVIELTESGIIVFDGNYDYYLEKKDLFNFNNSASQDSKSEKKTNDYFEQKKKQSYIKSLTKKYEKCEEDILFCEEEIERLNKELEENGSDLEMCQTLYKELDIKTKEQEELYKLFEELEEKLSNE
ncbi:MAG: ABC-F family ATP-binding cassette domain-containing protein [Ruminococcaceae bacterium]|nr:ABC-F family ATP-binding cassette domain-containing protein [Oscillospiraceae bacterium]